MFNRDKNRDKIRIARQIPRERFGLNEKADSKTRSEKEEETQDIFEINYDSERN
jgi:hypothetical protein